MAGLAVANPATNIPSAGQLGHRPAAAHSLDPAANFDADDDIGHRSSPYRPGQGGAELDVVGLDAGPWRRQGRPRCADPPPGPTVDVSILDVRARRLHIAGTSCAMAAGIGSLKSGCPVPSTPARMLQGHGQEHPRHDGKGRHEGTRPRALAEELSVRRPEQMGCLHQTIVGHSSASLDPHSAGSPSVLDSPVQPVPDGARHLTAPAAAGSGARRWWLRAARPPECVRWCAPPAPWPTPPSPGCARWR